MRVEVLVTRPLGLCDDPSGGRNPLSLRVLRELRGEMKGYDNAFEAGRNGKEVAFLPNSW